MPYVNQFASFVQSLNPDPTGNPTSTVTGSAGNYSLGGTVMDSAGDIHAYTTPEEGGVLNDSKVHKNLDPRLWTEDERLIPEVKNKLLEIANFFKDLVQFYAIEDIKITGSEANYNYTETSDIDLHLVYDFNKMNLDPHLLTTYFKAKKQLFNNEYTITVKGIPVELGVEDLNTPLVATGSYSLLLDDWIMKPTNSEKEIPDIYDNDLNIWKRKIDRAIATKDSEVISYVWKEIRDLRKHSLYSATGGEFAIGNLVFKRLRAEGDIDRLRNALADAISKRLSLENVDTTLSSEGEIRSFV